MRKNLEGKNQKWQLVVAAAAGAVMANMPHLEFVIAAIAIILVLVSFKDTKLKKGVVRLLKAIVIAIIIVAAMAWHNLFCNTKEETNNELAQQHEEVVIDEQQPIVEDQPVEETVVEEATSANSRSKKSFYN